MASQEKNTPPLETPFWKTASFWISALPLIISAIALGYSILAREDARLAREDARLAREDARGIHKLELKPQINLKTYFGKTGELVPHFIVENEGPVDAVLINTQLIAHRYNESSKSIKFSGYSTSHNWVISELSPFQFKVFQFSEDFLNITARLQKPVQHNVMEIRLTYSRPSDLLRFKESAYYFVNPEGMWVPEGERSLQQEPYESIKRAVFQASEKQFEYLGRSDTLHKIDVSNVNSRYR